LVAVIAVNEESERQLAWSVNAVRQGECVGLGFCSGKGDAKTVAAVSSRLCAVCGDEILNVEPHELELGLPEWRVGVQYNETPLAHR